MMTMTMDKDEARNMCIRFGIAGFRHAHGEYLLNELARQRADIRLMAIAEDDPVLREQLARRLGVTTYADYREMLERERLDAVGVVAVNGERARIIQDCLAAGLHVIADKPLCTRLVDLTAIEAAWRRSGRLLSVMLEKRFFPPTLALRGIVDSGRLGDLVLAWASGPHRLRRAGRPAWMFRHDSYGGILNDLAIHDIDVLLRLSGARSGQTQGLTGNRGNRDLPEFEDYGQVYLKTDTGLLATIEVHWFSPEAAPYHGDYRLVLTGTQGTAEARWAHNELLVATHREPPHHIALPAAQSPVADFFTAVRLGAEQHIRAEEVFAATRIALLAQATANTAVWQPWAIGG